MIESRFLRIFACLVALLGMSTAWGLELLEREVIISESDIQAALARSKPVSANYGGLLTVTMKTPPSISLAHSDGRAGIAGRVEVQILGGVPIPVDVTGRAGIRYDERTKAFYLDKPVADSVQSPGLSREAEPGARQAISQLIASYFRSKPVYVLREDGSPEEIAARWLLKSVRIESGRVVAILSPL